MMTSLFLFAPSYLFVNLARSAEAKRLVNMKCAYIMKKKILLLIIRKKLLLLFSVSFPTLGNRAEVVETYPGWKRYEIPSVIRLRSRLAPS